MFRPVFFLLLGLFTQICSAVEDGIQPPAVPGVFASEIILGISNAQDGPAKALGQAYYQGYKAWFDHLNEKGGINGRLVRLKILDDGYEPLQAIANTRTLINDQKVFLLTGYVGTPTAQAAVPIAEESQIPFVFPFTGAEFLRNPVKPLVFNLRASYFMETEEMARYLCDNLKLTKIAILYQDDSFGRAGLAGLEIAMKKRNLEIFGQANYPRNTLAVRKAAMTMQKLQPEAIVMIGAYAPCAEFIAVAKKLGLTATKYVNISFVGSEALLEKLNQTQAGEGVLVTQVVPFPKDKSLPGVAEYLKIGDSIANFQPGFVSLEGFLAAKLLGEILKKAGKDLDRPGFVKAAESFIAFDLGAGDPVSFSSTRHQGFNKVYLTEIKDGNFVPVQ